MPCLRARVAGVQRPCRKNNGDYHAITRVNYMQKLLLLLLLLAAVVRVARVHNPGENVSRGVSPGGNGYPTILSPSLV